MPPKTPRPSEPTQRWTFLQLFGLVKRNPLMLSRWVICWALIGIVCGLFAGLYWNILELMTHVLEEFTGPILLFVMPLAGLVVGLVIYFLGNPGEIAVIVDNIHFRGGRLDARKNPSMLLASLVSISAGGSAGPEAPLVQVTGSFGTWVADRLKLEGEDLRSGGMDFHEPISRLRSPICRNPWTDLCTNNPGRIGIRDSCCPLTPDTLLWARRVSGNSGQFISRCVLVESGFSEDGGNQPYGYRGLAGWFYHPTVFYRGLYR